MDSARDVEITSAGNIRTGYRQNLVLGNAADYADLEFDGTNWNLVGAQVIGDVSSALTIAAGAVTANRPLHTVDTEAAAAVDDLDTINGGQVGALLTIGIVNDARIVVLTQAGNLRFNGGRARVVNNVLDRVVLRFDGTNWVEVQTTNQSDGLVRRKSSQGPSAARVGTGAYSLSQAFPAGTLRVGDTIRIKALARVTVNAGAGTIVADLAFAGIVVAASTAADLGVNGYVILKADVRILTVGAGGTFTSLGEAFQRTTGAGAPTATTVQDTIASAVNTDALQSVTANATNSDAADESILEILEVDFL